MPSAPGIYFFTVSGGPYGCNQGGRGDGPLPSAGTALGRSPTLAVSEDPVGDLRRSQQQLLEFVVDLEQCERCPCHLE